MSIPTTFQPKTIIPILSISMSICKCYVLNLTDHQHYTRFQNPDHSGSITLLDSIFRSF
jgi:hypothetical protein